MSDKGVTLHGYSVKLPEGRKVFLSQAEDKHWFIVFTNAALEDEETKLKLSPEAMDALVDLHDHIQGRSITSSWTNMLRVIISSLDKRSYASWHNVD